MRPEPYQYLPNAAKCALEYLSAQNTSDRSIAVLDKFIDFYFSRHGQVCDQHIRHSCHLIACNRYDLEGEQRAGFCEAPA